MYILRHGGVAAALLMLMALGAVGCSASQHPRSAGAVPRIRDIKDAGQSQSKGDLHSTLSCEPANVGSVAVVQSGVSASALSALDPSPLAVVADAATGRVAFFHSSATPTANAASAMFTGAYQIVPDDPSLQSCDLLLADRPAAQPFITAAISSVVANGMAASASSLRANLAGIEIGDNPLATGSLVVVLLVTRASQGTVAGHTIYGPDSSVFVILNQADMAVPASAKGPGD